MEQFGIKDGGYKESRKGEPLKTIIFVSLVILAPLALLYIKSPALPDDPRLVGILLFVFAVLGVAVFISFYLANKKLKRLFESYTLTFEDQLITREQYDTPTVSILRNEVSDIRKNKKGGFTVTGNSLRNRIKVPEQIENPEKLERLLENIVPVKAATNQFFTMKNFAQVAVIPAGIILVEYSENKTAIGTGAVLLIFGLVYSFIETQQDRNLDYGTKRYLWITIIIAIPFFKSIYDKLF